MSEHEYTMASALVDLRYALAQAVFASRCQPVSRDALDRALDGLRRAESTLEQGLEGTGILDTPELPYAELAE